MNEEQWKAIVDCDKSCDGAFFYGVLTTGIYCRPSCKSRTPKRENVRVYRNSASAEADGLRACKRCRPELLTTASAVEELVEKTRDLIARAYMEDLTLDEMARRFYVSPFYLQRVFKQHMHTSPAEYLTRTRIKAAKELLANPALTVTQIALHVGYKSPAHFSNVFYKKVGYAPSRYRSLHATTENA